jgi:hypothetical protein
MIGKHVNSHYLSLSKQILYSTLCGKSLGCQSQVFGIRSGAARPSTSDQTTASWQNFSIDIPAFGRPAEQQNQSSDG